MLAQLNAPIMYAIVGIVVGFVGLSSLFFMVRAYRAGVAMGMDPGKLKSAITASATFAVLPSVGILLGVIALSGSLGTPLPWLRLSVVGALHYETQVAESAAEAVGLNGLNIAAMTPKAFSTIALVMSGCIIWGMVFAILFTKRYTSGRRKKKKAEKASIFSGFADTAMNAMFIGLVSCYIGHYISTLAGGSPIPALVALVGGVSMAGFLYLKDRKNQAWVDSFSIAGSMLIAMASAVLFGRLF